MPHADIPVMGIIMRRLGVFLILLAVALAASATTLEELSLDQMIQQSTAIVRAKVSSKSAITRGQSIYTQYRLSVLQQWKGTPATSVDVVVPGGVAGGLRQTFSGTPDIGLNSECVFFLWTGSSGLTHIIGLSQGIFELTTESNGTKVAARPELKAAVITPDGKPASGAAVRMTLADLTAQIEAVLGGAGR